VFARLVAAGYPPFRLGAQSRALAPAHDPATRALVDTLRAAIDPRRILS
jgi:hypothetical protein